MSCSEIDGDICLFDMPPIPFCAKQIADWNGKRVEVLDPSHTLLGENIKIPTFPDQNADAAAFYQRNLVDLTHADSDQKADHEGVLEERMYKRGKLIDQKIYRPKRKPVKYKNARQS